MNRSRAAALRPWVVACTLVFIFSPARIRALPAGKAITQYRHDVWLPKDGLPASSRHSREETR